MVGTGMNRGQLISWNDSKGFGFIKSESFERDMFIHISSLKSMSRKPKTNDFIYFDVEKQPDGKSKATNCRIEGVLALKQTSKSNSYKKKSSSVASNFFSITVVVVLILFGYQRLGSKVDRYTPSTNSEPQIVEQFRYTSSPNVEPQIIEKTYPISSFSCDGRQHCSQMNSRAEAVYFIRHCPNTKMDGDRDGIPCENDSRF